MLRQPVWHLLFITALLRPSLIWADGDGERTALARLDHEIEALEPLIREAELQGDLNARIRFQYDWLRRDLRQIRFAIEEHIEAPQSEPRKVPPLLGDYRR